MKKVHIQIIVILMAVWTMVACSDKKPQTQQEAPVKVNVVTVGDDPSVELNSYVGSIVESSGTSLSFEVPGKIVSLTADEGDRIAKGQLLGTVDPTTLRDAHAQAVTALRQARDAYKRYEALHKQGVISDIRWVEVQSQLEQAESAEHMARTQLGRTHLVAPFAGVISQRTADQGMNVLAGQQIFRLVDIATVDARISVPEKEVSGIHIGAKAIVNVAAVGNRSYCAVLTEKGVEADVVSHTYTVKLRIANTDGKLMPGMVCNVNLSNHSTNQNSSSALAPVLTVPLDAIKLDADNRRFVWTAVDGKACQQFITIGDFTETGVIVTQGLHAGDKVITEGSQKISQGMSITTDK